MDETDVFVQIYIFYPTFGQKQRDFRPNLYFLHHIWTKSVFLLFQRKKQPRPSVMTASVVCLCSFSFFYPYLTSLQNATGALHSYHADITETFYRTYDALTYGFFWDTENLLHLYKRIPAERMIQFLETEHLSFTTSVIPAQKRSSNWNLSSTL